MTTHRTMPDREDRTGPGSGVATVRVVTYNVHACRGADGREDVARIAGVLAELDPDIVALQEVQWHDDAEHDQLGRIARELDMETVAAATMRKGGAWFGNAVVSRLPVVDHARFELGRGDGEPRCALRVDVGSGASVLSVVTTHLGLTLRTRHAQMDRLVSVLAEVANRALVVMGDFNAWIPRRDVARRLGRRFGAGSGGRTFPAVRPLLPLDRIWAVPPGVIHSWHVHQSMQSRIASDHLPVCADLRL